MYLIFRKELKEKRIKFIKFKDH